MTEDWELEFRVQTCAYCGELFCQEQGIEESVVTGFNTKRTMFFCGTFCQDMHKLERHST